MAMLGATCSPCCAGPGVMAVALRGWGSTLNCWNYTGWDYPDSQYWSDTGYTTLSGSPGLGGQPGSSTGPGSSGGVYRNDTLRNTAARIMIKYGESSTSIRLRLTHYEPSYPPGGSTSSVASEVEIEYEKQHPAGAPQSRHESGLWEFSPANGFTIISVYRRFSQYQINLQDIGSITLIQKAPSVDLSRREYLVSMSFSSPIITHGGPDVCGNPPSTESMAGVSGSTFDLTLDQIRLNGDWHDSICEFDQSEEWSLRRIEAAAWRPGAFLTPETSGPLRISADGGFKSWYCPTEEKLGVDCTKCVPVYMRDCNSVLSEIYFSNAFLSISPYAWLAFSVNGNLSGQVSVGSWYQMRFPGGYSQVVFARYYQLAGYSFGNMTFSIEMTE